MKWENNPENSAEVKALPLLLILPNAGGEKEHVDNCVMRHRLKIA